MRQLFHFEIVSINSKCFMLNIWEQGRHSAPMKLHNYVDYYIKRNNE